ncbi:MAG TPA: RlmE family RNA methyltransferase [Anaerolineae bacterium]|nr:RlmE family RNA methyltransferase [Anaerolineae bacterium]
MGREWRRQQQRDYYFRKAKEEGYRSRAAYKLLQINRRHKLIRGGDVVLDLGAAPGGWSQVAAKLVGPQGTVVAVDKVAMEPLPGVTFVQGDLTAPDLAERIRALVGTVDVVLSDAAPSTSGVRLRDHALSIALAQAALRVARALLKPGGHLVVKAFEGEDFPAFLAEVRRHFRSVKPYSPPASRRESAEVYVVAKGFRGI